MSEKVALRAPLEEDLSGFSAYLATHGIPHRIIEQGGRQVVLVPAERYREWVQQAYHQQLHRAGVPGSPPTLPVTPPRSSTLTRRLRAVPLTTGLILLSALGAAVVFLGRLDWLATLSFQPFVIFAQQPVFRSFEQGMAAGEYWRLVTPLFLHFNVLHLVFNALWTWELGGSIERIQGAGRLLGLVLLTGLVSNLVQYHYQPDIIFGGMSGVIYGLLGYSWVWQKLVPQESLNLSGTLFWVLVGFMLLMMTGVFGLLGFGEIANAAHTGGLLAGMLTGGLFGWRRRQHRA